MIKEYVVFMCIAARERVRNEPPRNDEWARIIYISLPKTILKLVLSVMVLNLYLTFPVHTWWAKKESSPLLIEGITAIHIFTSKIF